MTANPSAAIALVQRGMLAQQGGNLTAAADFYRQALTIDPDQFEALHFLGVLEAQRGNLFEADRLVGRSLAINAQRAEAHVNHARILRSLDRPVAAIERCDQALARNPQLVDAHILRGNCLRDLGRFAEALAAYERALALRPNYAEAVYNRSLIHLIQGQYEQGFAGYERRFNTAEPVATRMRVRAQPWSGEPLQDRSMLVYWEQGFGDILQFARYVPLLARAGAKVTFVVPKRLLRLLTPLAVHAELATQHDDARAFDFCCPLMSLPHGFKTGLSTIPADIPYLRAEDERVAHWRARMGGHGLKVGVGWQGNPASGAEQGRSVPLAQLSPIASVPGVRLVSLQKFHGLDQLEHLPSGMTVETLGDDFDSGPDAFVDTAAVMANLDLVVTIDSVLGHLAGALGRRTWTLLQRVPH